MYCLHVTIYSGTCVIQHMSCPTSCDKNVWSQIVSFTFFVKNIYKNTFSIPKPVTSVNRHCFPVLMLLSTLNYSCLI